MCGNAAWQTTCSGGGHKCATQRSQCASMLLQQLAVRRCTHGAHMLAPRHLLSCLSTSTLQVVLQPSPVVLMPVPTARPRQLKQAPTVLKHTDRRCELHAHRQRHSTSANSPHGWHAFPVLYPGPFGNAQLRVPAIWQRTTSTGCSGVTGKGVPVSALLSLPCPAHAFQVERGPRSPSLPGRRATPAAARCARWQPRGTWRAGGVRRQVPRQHPRHCDCSMTPLTSGEPTTKPVRLTS